MINKTNGAYAEMIFAARIIERSLPISIPLLDIFGFDAVVGSNQLKVQIKSSATIDKQGRYRWLLAHGSKCKTAYTRDKVDMFALYIPDLDIWHIIPIGEITCIYVYYYPTKEFKYDYYREAWHLLK